MSAAADRLLAAQRALRSRFEDFRHALERRDEAAYRMALTDFLENLLRWTLAEERVLLPALARADVPVRHPERELMLEYVQIRELTRALLSQTSEGGNMGDVLGLAENLERRLRAHESEMERVYYPAAAEVLTVEECATLDEAMPSP